MTSRRRSTALTGRSGYLGSAGASATRPTRDTRPPVRAARRRFPAPPRTGRHRVRLPVGRGPTLSSNPGVSSQPSSPFWTPMTSPWTTSTGWAASTSAVAAGEVVSLVGDLEHDGSDVGRARRGPPRRPVRRRTRGATTETAGDRDRCASGGSRRRSSDPVASTTRPVPCVPPLPDSRIRSSGCEQAVTTPRWRSRLLLGLLLPDAEPLGAADGVVSRLVVAARPERSSSVSGWPRPPRRRCGPLARTAAGV